MCLVAYVERLHPTCLFPCVPFHHNRSSTKGVMVPPICVDMNGDGINDLLMLAYDGNLTLFDGHHLTTMWTTNLNGAESYR